MLKYVPDVLTKRSACRTFAPAKPESQPLCLRLSARKIRQITSHFGRAAIQARKAGFDIVQIHGDRMLGSFGLPRYSITAPMNTAVPLKTVSDLPWKR